MTSKQEQLDALKDNLADWLPRSGSVESLLDVAAASLADLDGVIETSETALRVKTAPTIDDLYELGEPFAVVPGETDTVDEYRQKVESAMRQLTRTGTPENIVRYTADLLDVDLTVVQYQNITGEPKARLRVPGDAISNSPVGDVSTAVEFINDQSAAQYQILIETTGTLKYASETDYQNGTHVTQNGYATLDVNGNPTDGGTYGTAYN
jgi:hypothetical protein